MIQEKRIKHLLKVLIRNKQKDLSVVMSFMKQDDPKKERYTNIYFC